MGSKTLIVGARQNHKLLLYIIKVSLFYRYCLWNWVSFKGIIVSDYTDGAFSLRGTDMWDSFRHFFQRETNLSIFCLLFNTASAFGNKVLLYMDWICSVGILSFENRPLLSTELRIFSRNYLPSKCIHFPSDEHLHIIISLGERKNLVHVRGLLRFGCFGWLSLPLKTFKPYFVIIAFAWGVII